MKSTQDEVFCAIAVTMSSAEGTSSELYEQIKDRYIGETGHEYEIFKIQSFLNAENTSVIYTCLLRDLDALVSKREEKDKGEFAAYLPSEIKALAKDHDLGERPFDTYPWLRWYVAGILKWSYDNLEKKNDRYKNIFDFHACPGQIGCFSRVILAAAIEMEYYWRDIPDTDKDVCKFLIESSYPDVFRVIDKKEDVDFKVLEGFWLEPARKTADKDEDENKKVAELTGQFAVFSDPNCFCRSVYWARVENAPKKYLDFVKSGGKNGNRKQLE